MTTTPTMPSRRSAPRPFRPILLGILLIAALAAGTGCDASLRSSPSVQGSGTSAVQARTLPPFRSVELAGSNEVSVRIGGEQAVIVHGDDNLLRYVTTRVRGGRLVIDNSRSFSTRSPMRVEVTMPSIDSLALSGSGAVEVGGLRGESFSASIPGSGVLTATGAVGRVTASVAGSGQLQLRRLVARDVVASVTGSGQIDVQATRSLDASISGSGDISYSGSPGRVSRHVTGSGVVAGS